LGILSTGEPPYWPTDVTKTPDLRDYFVFKLLSHNYLGIKTNLEISSDHTPIITTIGTHIITGQQPLKLHNSKTIWEAFRTEIEENLGQNIPFKTAEEVEDAITQFNKDGLGCNIRRQTSS
jgi:hypothetical protein